MVRRKRVQVDRQRVYVQNGGKNEVIASITLLHGDLYKGLERRALVFSTQGQRTGIMGMRYGSVEAKVMEATKKRATVGRCDNVWEAWQRS